MNACGPIYRLGRPAGWSAVAKLKQRHLAAVKWWVGGQLVTKSSQRCAVWPMANLLNGETAKFRGDKWSQKLILCTGDGVGGSFVDSMDTM